MAENSLNDLKEFFGVDAKEMREVWVTMTDKEKAEWKNAELKTS